MDEKVVSPTIKPIKKNVVHRICSGQVILDLPSAVKELVENSLDAGATSIEINLKEYGEESFKVIDNGCGISSTNFQVLALKHHTSKIADFPDLQSLTTFGFRGEALSSLCALGNLTIETRTKTDPVGTHLTFDHSGLVTSEKKTARQIGTTVIVEKLFSTLPVRSKEFSRNIRREYGKLITLLNAYAVIAKGVRLICSNISGKSSKSVVLKTQGSFSIRDNIITVLGMNTFTCLEPLNVNISDECKVEGFLSKPGNGCGRNTGDRQFFYVNGRPVDMPKVSKLVNESYRSANSKQYPIAVMNFVIPTKAYDVNVTPDKRKIFFSDEANFILLLKEAIEDIYSPGQHIFSVKQRGELTEHDLDKDSVVHMHDEEKSNILLQPISRQLTDKYDGSTEMEQSNSTMSPLHDKEKVLLASDPIYVGNRRKEAKRSVQDTDMGGETASRKKESFSVRNIAVPHGCSTKSENQNRQLQTPFSNSPLHSTFIKSSPTTFVSVNKRKHEHGHALLSESPVLRNGVRACEIRKICSGVKVGVSRSMAPQKENEVNVDDSLEDYGAAIHLSNCLDVSGSPSHSDAKKDEVFSNHRKYLICEDSEMQDSATEVKDASITSSDKFIQSQSVSPTLDTPKHGSVLDKCYNLHFNLKDLRKRREQRQSRSRLSSSPLERCKMKSCYAAATLETSQPETENGKAGALASATIELERIFRKEDFGRMKVIGQFNLGFIIGKVDNNLFIVDQHAADEKYNYERLSMSTIFNQQPLLQPMILELSPEEEVVASLHMDVIRKNGFTLTEDPNAVPGHRLLLKAVPFSQNMTFGVEDVKELISTLADNQGECSILGCYKMDEPNSICPSRVRNLLASRACRSSIMIGDPLNRNEMEKILRHLAGLRSPWNCPHGRPTMRHLINLAKLWKCCQFLKIKNAYFSIRNNHCWDGQEQRLKQKFVEFESSLGCFIRIISHLFCI